MRFGAKEESLMASRWPLYVSVAVAFYGLLCVAIYVAILHANGGHFLFTIDDPYIHLALSEQIAHGQYGINAGVAASPSSSILWPYLLTLFVGLPWQDTVVLVLNLLCGVGTAAVLGRMVAEWPMDDGSREEAVRRSVSAVGLVLVANLIGLTFLGMEHVLQVFLVSVCALGLGRALRGAALPWWCLLAAAVAPSVRYEDLGITLVVVACLIGQRRHAQAAAVSAAGVLPPVAFAMYLHRLGLPTLPLSVLLKGGGLSDSQPAVHRFLRMARINLQQTVNDREHMLLVVLFLTLVGLAWASRGAEARVRRYVFAGTAAAVALQLMVGPFGWLHRYEVYSVLLSLSVVLYAVHERPRALLGWYALALLACCSTSIAVTSQTVAAAHDVYLQQYQMHRFVTEFAEGNVAVNDLGLVSYRRRPGQEVLDLIGLGSFETAKVYDKSAAWLDAVTQRHRTAIVMIYVGPGWLPETPTSWTELGKVCEQGSTVIAGGNCVSYFATPQADLDRARSSFTAFSKTLPPGDTVQWPSAR